IRTSRRYRLAETHLWLLLRLSLFQRVSFWRAVIMQAHSAFLSRHSFIADQFFGRATASAISARSVRAGSARTNAALCASTSAFRFFNERRWTIKAQDGPR